MPPGKTGAAVRVAGTRRAAPGPGPNLGPAPAPPKPRPSPPPEWLPGPARPGPRGARILAAAALWALLAQPVRVRGLTWVRARLGHHHSATKG